MQNVVYWIGVKNKDPHMNDKHGGFSYLDVSRKTWEWWCQKNNVIFVPYELPDYNPEKPGTKVTWQRWFDMKRVISDKGVTPNWIWAVDGSTMIRWDAPAPWNQQELNPEITRSRLSPKTIVYLPFREDHSLRADMYADIYEKSLKQTRRSRRSDRLSANYENKGKFIKNPSVFYTVKKGDTLWRVAQRTGVPMSTIIRTNRHIIKRRSILPGDRLAIR
jgi:hypothetical protein